MATTYFVWYEGEPSGWALVKPPGVSDGKADLIVFDEYTAAPTHRDDVPNDESGGGHTWRHSQ
jgi:hypothetical protein